MISNSQGQPVEKPNAICMHEIDDGIGWKHTNGRTGAVSIVRSRVLVLQTIITVGNYEYVLYVHSLLFMASSLSLLMFFQYVAFRPSSWSTLQDPSNWNTLNSSHRSRSKRAMGYKRQRRSHGSISSTCIQSAHRSMHRRRQK